ncbi:MAG: hypothetical protein JXR96_28245, partial [Deltaproteobacteria bacterium]|nr:hypothetical protein [Deltaproteobacteria bacterium]
ADDNCGIARRVDCGGCTAPETCGAVEPNRCGCSSHASLRCYLDDYWWYDGCGQPEEIHTDCDYHCGYYGCYPCMYCWTIGARVCGPGAVCSGMECLWECRYTGDIHEGQNCTMNYLVEDCGASGQCCTTGGCVPCK